MKIPQLAYLLLLKSLCFAVTPHAYVTNLNSGTVTVIDVAHDTVQTIYGFTNPRTVVVTPNGQYAYVGCDDNTVRIIDTKTNTVLSTVIEVSHPTALAVSPDGLYVYVASDNDTLNAISTETNEIVGTVGGLSNVQDVVITADNAFAYVTNEGNDTVSQIRLSDYTIVDTLEGFNKPQGISISPDSTYAYVTNIGNGKVTVVQLSDNTIHTEISGFGNPQYGAPTPDGKYVYVSDMGYDKVVRIRTSDFTIANAISVAKPSSLAISPDGAYLYSSENDTAVDKFKIADHSLVYKVENLGLPSNISMANTDPDTHCLLGYQDVCQQKCGKDFRNVIIWNAAAGNPVAYQIFRDSSRTHLLGEVNGNTLHFEDRHRHHHRVYDYYVTALYADGFSTSVGTVQVGEE